MKISKARLKQIIKEELEAVVNEEEEEEKIEEIGLGGMGMPGGRPGSHRDRPSYRGATVGGRVASRTPTLDAAAEALGVSPSQLMMALAQEMGAVPGDEDVPSEPPLEVPEGE